MTASPIGYAVVVFNQASRQPDLVEGSFTDDREWADQLADSERERTANAGRRETYAVVELREVER